MDNRLPLSNDLFFSLYSLLSIQDLLNFARTSKYHYQLASDSRLWKNLSGADNYIDFKKNATPKESYQELIGFRKEKEYFISYMVCLTIIKRKFDDADEATNFKYQNYSFNHRNREHIDDMIQNQEEWQRFYKTQQVVNQELISLDNCILHSDQSFEQFYNKIITSISSTELSYLRKAWHDVYILMLSNNLENFVNFYLFKEDNIDKKMNKTITTYNLILLALCKLDAHLSMNVILTKNDYLINHAELWVKAFQYPCINIVKKLLSINIPLNKKSWLIDEENDTIRLKISPFAAIIIGIHRFKGKKITVYKDIISLCLNKDADNKLNIFISENDWNSKAEYNERQITIDEFCKNCLKNNITNLNFSGDILKHFTEAMELIIHYQKPSLHQPSCCTLL